ncbi:MAG: hypothetical protein LBR80_13220 [Deltaproteobacteria bacterium]|jgi:hypothetical protein|nr:hypothetical protein [Deltaproteobacteria bacterium]
MYTLDYPNLEVRAAISTLFLENLNPSCTDIGVDGEELKVSLANRDIPGMVGVFSRILGGIICFDHADATRRYQNGDLAGDIRMAAGHDIPDESVRKLTETFAEKLLGAQGESFHRSVLHACLWMAGAKVTSGKDEGPGRLDLEAVYGKLTYAIELKMSEDAAGAVKAAERGTRQMGEKGYGLASQNPIRVSLAIGRKERNIVACLFEIDGRASCVLMKHLNMS